MKLKKTFSNLHPMEEAEHIGDGDTAYLAFEILSWRNWHHSGTPKPRLNQEQPLWRKCNCVFSILEQNNFFSDITKVFFIFC